MKRVSILSLAFLVVTIHVFGQPHLNSNKRKVIDDTGQTEIIEQVIKIDRVWAGHPVGFCLLTHGDRQYIAYYNAERSMVVGQRDLKDEKFSLHVLPRTSRETSGGTSTVLNWDSHNSVTLGVDKEGFIHLSGNMHVHPITYFRSVKPYDISTLTQIMSMVGINEMRCTYPRFMTTKEGELIFHYRDGGSGNGNEIYNIYSCETKKWSRLLDTPLTDGQGLMNAYLSQPALRSDSRYHIYWVWRDTPDCSTNHDLSYMRSPDLKNWFNFFDEPVKLPVTDENKAVIVDPIPVKGGIINLAAKLCLDKKGKPVFAYHKYGPEGNLQLYIAKPKRKKWAIQQITDWDYRWEFSGRGSINNEVLLKDFLKRDDGFYELNYWHIKYGNGTILLDKKWKNIGEVLKPVPFRETIAVEGTFPGLLVQTSKDLGQPGEQRVRYLLKWETLNRNRDLPRTEPWPEPSQLYLYKLRKTE